MHFKNIFSAACFLFFIGNTFSQANPKPLVIPSLQQWHGGNGDFLLTSHSVVLFSKNDKAAQKVASVLVTDLKEMGWNSIPSSDATPKTGDIVFGLQQHYDSALGREGYRLEIKKTITVAANTYRGLFWGSRTLLQLLEQGKNGSIPQGIAVDWPKYPIRGFMLDDGRKFFSLEFLKRYVKLMAYYKMGDFQIHLNDNGFKKHFWNNWDSTYAGFHLQSETYPHLANKGEFYTKKEFRDLQRMAQDYGVNIIPEIDMPAHALAFAHMDPTLGSKKYGMDHLDLNNPKVYEVADNLYKEYLSGPNPVFVGPDVHIGTDEYAKAESEMFRGFTDHLIRLVQSYGKSVRAWGALTHAAGKTPVTSQDVTLNIWYNGYADPIEMKKQGYKLISTPDGYLYIVPAAGYYYDYLNLPYLYREWTPLQIGNVRFQEGDTSLLGGMFAIWNDVINNGITAMDAHDRIFPAMQVLSEKMWSGVTDTLDYQAFARNAARIGEGPGSNMIGRFPAADSLALAIDVASSQVKYSNGKKNGTIRLSHVKTMATPKDKAFLLSKKNSYIETPIEHVGFDYKVQFDIFPDKFNSNMVLSSDPVWKTSIQILSNGRIAIHREKYKDTFDYPLPLHKWTSLSFEGNNKAISLFVNGHLQQKLAGYRIPTSDKDTIFYVQTLFFPLKRIGDDKNAFQGKISNVKVYMRKRR